MTIQVSIAAVVFDLDGVLIDSERIYVRAWHQVADELDCPALVPAYVDVVGLPYDQIEPIIHANLNDRVSMAEFQTAINGAVRALTKDGYPSRHPPQPPCPENYKIPASKNIFAMW